MNKFNTYKVSMNKIKNQLPIDEINYFKSIYNKEDTVGTTWNTVNDYLGTSKKSRSNTHSMLIHNNTAYTTPRDVANTFNRIFLDKVRQLTRQTNGAPTIEPRDRL